MKTEATRKQLLQLITDFETELKSDNLRNKVLALVSCFQHLRELGKSLIPVTTAKNARDRILHYFKKYPGTIISRDELHVISGIQGYTRRVGELKVQFGWTIVSGLTAN